MAGFVTSDGVRLHYESQGRGRRVFACAGGSANDFRYLAEDLMPLTDDFEFVYHDYRRSGRSKSASIESYTFERLSDDVDEPHCSILPRSSRRRPRTKWQRHVR